MKLLTVMRAAQKGVITIGRFCDDFENIYNFEINKNELRDNERAIFDHMFDRAAWYSPFVSERATTPHYLSEIEILNDIEQTLVQLAQLDPLYR